MEVDTSDFIITLAPGDGTQTLQVHSSLLFKHSRFFQNATKKEWTNGDDSKNIPLPEDLFDIVKVFTDWLYSQTIDVKLYKAGGETREKRAEEAENVFITLAEAYVFGEKYLAVGFKNAVMHTTFAAIKSSSWNLGPDSVKIIYDGTPPNSPLRRFLADRIACKGRDDSDKGVGWMQFLGGYPEQALREALMRTLQLRGPNTTYVLEPELYLEEE